jgi:hypothetical protein
MNEKIKEIPFHYNITVRGNPNGLVSRHLKSSVWGLVIWFLVTNCAAIRSIDIETAAKRFASLLPQKLRLHGLSMSDSRSSIRMEKSGKWARTLFSPPHNLHIITQNYSEHLIRPVQQTRLKERYKKSREDNTIFSLSNSFCLHSWGNLMRLPD